jgi:site-specific recombinase XerD
MKIKQKTILEDFTEYLNTSPLPSRVRAGASENTIRGYVHDVGDFLVWWKQTEGDDLTAEWLRRDPFALNKKTIQDYIAYLERRKAAVGTVLRKVSSLRAFTRFLKDAKIIEHEPINGMRLPTKAEPEPRGLSDKDRSRFEAVFQQPWLDRAPKRKRTDDVEKNVLEDAANQLIRDRAIVFLMMYAGPRVDEVFQLNVGDIDLREKSGSLHIRKGKGLRERRTSIPLPARKTLQKWLELRADLNLGHNPHDATFVRLRGEPGMRLSVRAMQNMVAEAGRRAKIKEPVTPHILRHTCAFMLRKAGADIETRAKMLGHSVKTASKYGAPGESEIAKAAALLDYAEAA